MSFDNDVIDNEKNARILIVDDNKDIHDDFKLILGATHSEKNEELDDLDELLEHILDEKSLRGANDCIFELDSAFQGREALELVEEAYKSGRPYTVVFMDVRMPPGWNGIETIRQIWKKFPETEMVICTAYSDFSWEEINQTLGSTHRLLMLKKPFDRMEVKQLALSLTVKSKYYKKYQQNISELEKAVKLRTKELEEAKVSAEIANRAKSTFLANMSHELRTPLNAILGYAELMARESDLTDVQEHHLGIVQRSGNHLLSLINNVLDLSKIEAGLMEKTESNFNLHTLIQDVKQMLLPRCHRHNLTLRVELEPNVPEAVKGDERKLRQILINLLGNSVKFTSAGQITLAVSRDNGKIKFNVTDTGQGIPQEDLVKIFKPFQQSATQTGEAGTGLGLNICYNFVQLLGGQLEVESQVGQGSSFFFSIELTMLDDVVLAHEKNRKVVSILGDKKWSILIVDSDELSRNFLATLLEKVGFSIVQAENGRDGLERVEQYVFDLIISGVKMPIMNGEEFIKEVKQRKVDIPFVFTSAFVLGADENRLMALNANAFIGKPINVENLFQVMEQCTGIEYEYSVEPEEPPPALTCSKDMRNSFKELPRQQQELLMQYANHGNVRQIRNQANELKQTDEWQDLGNHICEMVMKYDMDGLLKLFADNS